MSLTKEQVLDALATIAELPQSGQKFKGRTIYETGDALGRGTGKYAIDYASYPGGTAEDVSRKVIDELERDGFIRRAFPNKPEINAWVLA